MNIFPSSFFFIKNSTQTKTPFFHQFVLQHFITGVPFFSQVLPAKQEGDIRRRSRKMTHLINDDNLYLHSGIIKRKVPEVIKKEESKDSHGIN